ncbi:hypothetical protein QA612_07960 [Evansella sp. AB-P1]|uniref:hypothetical protein n=1 Tax=Evansella sp. AB-P1 TaxID=3037653 RepID=UPI00241DADBA|nr:hypothetical protein [Evansella sp. AB-P1]MDG5787427.1 hypothetical protein [Evansella sp. AB-P1]
MEAVDVGGSSASSEHMSVGKWVITFILLAIPLLNLILLFVWGFGADNPRKSYSQAVLLFMVIGFVLWIVFVALSFFAFGGLSLFG